MSGYVYGASKPDPLITAAQRIQADEVRIQKLTAHVHTLRSRLGQTRKRRIHQCRADLPTHIYEALLQADYQAALQANPDRHESGTRRLEQATAEATQWKDPRRR